jgi:F-type H+-transporting ATPase subunit alpha
MQVEDQVIIIWAVTNGFGDDIAVEDLKRFEHELLDYLKNSHPGAMNTLREKKAIDDTLKKDLTEAVNDFKSSRWNQTAVAAA